MSHLHYIFETYLKIKNMKSKTIDINSLNVNSVDRICITNGIAYTFAQRSDSHINELYLFTALFNTIPNFIHEKEIDCKKANQWFLNTYNAEIKDFFYDKIYFNGNKKTDYDDIFYILYEDLIVDFDTDSSMVRFLFKKTAFNKVEEIIKAIKKFKKRKANIPLVSLLANTKYGIDTTYFKITKPKLHIEDNYNDDFMEVHKTIYQRLSKKNDKGMVILHGKSGTGKTSYIRYLISSLKKKVIFLPPNMATEITNPGLISILIDRPNSIFVIEDAENIIVDREKDENSKVSTLLNISDGLLSDCLNIQIICSFNTDISKVDSALMRKGRLIAKYEFRELEAQKAQALSNKLGFDGIFKTPTTLTAIYNQGEKTYSQANKNKVGFKICNNN